jgi:hypothetical protein
MSQMHANRVSVMEECEGLARAGLASPRRSVVLTPQAIALSPNILPGFVSRRNGNL